ncbi:MAG: aminoacyl-tRNA hydrolase [Planctomycetota bacterium]|nr:aminoacyl-tRNA hydrolase [Planctomycetota bacterium]
MARILFGLGNPGAKYEQTRHNAGWQVLDVIAARAGASFKKTRLFKGEVADARVGDEVVRLIKPHSYMNLVGPVYLRCLDVYDLAPEEALVLVDDFQLEMGRLRLRGRGRHGGHNGLKSIEQILNTAQYPRLKIGIGPAPAGARWADYVLRGYDRRQKEALPELLARGADASEFWVQAGLTEAMNRYNPKAAEAPEEPPEKPA